MTKRRQQLWSVPRIKDPRYPGYMLRVTELSKGGKLYAVRMVDGRQKMVSLGCTRAELGSAEKEREAAARAKALDLIAELARLGQTNGSGSTFPPAALKTDTPLTLGQLADHYALRGSLKAQPGYRKDRAAQVRRVAEYFGLDRAVAGLKTSDLQSFYLYRTQGGRAWTAARSDLQALNSACIHAGREDLLAANPLDRVRWDDVVSKHTIRRPWATPERYAALRAQVGRRPPLHPGRVRKQERERQPIPLVFGVLLDLLWGTGHRISAVLALRWQDINFESSTAAPFGAIRWYAGCTETNKRNDHIVPMNQIARAALDEWRAARPGIGSALLFPCPGDPTRQMERRACKGWLRDAERMAGLAHEPQGGFHVFRRGWATLRKDMPLKDVAAAGGWTDTATLLKSYQHADPRTTLAVVTRAAGAGSQK